MPPESLTTDRVIRIQPRRGWISLNLKELWLYRDLLYFFIWRDWKVRYRQTLLGFAWAAIIPIANTIVFTILFGKFASLKPDLPYPVFFMIGFTVWRYFSGAMASTSASLVNNAPILTKIYFPRLLIPLNVCLSALAEFGISFVVTVGLMLYYGIIPAATIFLIPVLLLMTMTFALGLGLFFSALNVRYRDVGQLVPFLLQIWMYASVIVPFSEFSPERWGATRYLLGLNPMFGIIEMARWAMGHHVMTVDPPLGLLAMGLPVILFSLLIGLFYFKKTENLIADVI